MNKRSSDFDSNSDPEHVRRKYLYRRLAMQGTAKIPARLAMKMVGPDCAYHLYSSLMPNAKELVEGGLESGKTESPARE